MPRPDASRRRIAVLGSMLLASAFALSAFGARVAYTGAWSYRNLVWNLFLAWIPLVVALVVYDRHRRDARPLALLAPGVVWLVFLPNAPYLVTDFFLLRWYRGAPIWFDVLMLSAFAWTGLLLGFVSLYLVHTVVRRLYGSVAGWSLALGALALASFGVYLGRFPRWNSWDLFVRPAALLADVSSTLVLEKALAVTILFTSFLTTGYFVLYSWLRLALQEHDEPG